MLLMWSLFAVIAVAAVQQEYKSISPISQIQQFQLEKDEICLDSHQKSNSPLERQVDPAVITTRPKTFSPSHYDVELRVVLEDFELFNRHTIPAKVQIFGMTTENTTTIVLDACYININRSSIRVITGTRPLQIERTDHNIVKNTLLINLENEIKAGEKLEILIEYIAPLYQWVSSSGVYLVKYEDEGQYKQFVLSKFRSPVGTQFPTCSNAFPCFEDSQFKTTFNLTLFRKKDYTTEANGEFVASDPDPQFNEWMMDKYTWSTAIRPAMLTFVLFKEADFAFLENHFGNEMSLLKIYAPPQYIDKQGFQILANLSSQIFGCFENFIGMSSYLPKLKWFFVPNIQTEFENWGIIVNQLESEDLKTDNSFIENTIQSLALQMLGDREDPHVNQELSKSLKRYLEYVGLACGNIVLSKNKAGGSSVLDQNILNDLQYLELFGESWLKTAVVLRMLENVIDLGHTFKFYMKRIWSTTNRNVTMEEFYEMLQTASGNQVPFDTATVFRSFIDNDGFPLIRVGRANATHFKLRQESFQTQNFHHRNVTGNWHLPISLTVGTEFKQHLLWLTPDNNVTYVPANASVLIIANEDGRGYYRTFYEDPVHIQLIQKQLEFNRTVFGPVTRALLLSDHMTLAEEGYCSYGAALNFSKYLAHGKETEFVVWKTFLGRFTTETYVRFLMHSEFSKLENFLHPKIDVMLRNLEISSQRSPLEDYLLLYSCELQTPYCLEYANRLFSTWLETGSNPLDSIHQRELHSSLQCAIVSIGGSKAFDFLYENYEQVEEFLQAFACVRDEKLFQDVLQQTLDPPPSGYETSVGWAILQYMVAAPLPKMKGMILPIISRNFEMAKQKFGSQRIAQLVKYMANAWVFISEDDKNAVEGFVKQHQNQFEEEYGDDIMQLQEAIERIDLNIRWISSHGREILDSL